MTGPPALLDPESLRTCSIVDFGTSDASPDPQVIWAAFVLYDRSDAGARVELFSGNLLSREDCAAAMKDVRSSFISPPEGTASHIPMRS